MMRECILMSRKSAGYIPGLFFIAALAFFSVVPGYYGTGVAGAAILDATMPATIPADIIADWELRDNVATVGYGEATKSIISNLPPSYAAKAKQGTTKEAYLAAAHLQRVANLEPVASQIQQILYAKHYDLGGSIIGNIEDLNSDGYRSPCTDAKFNLSAMSKGTSFTKGSALLICKMSNYYGTSTTLLSDAGGVIRDPCLSYDAKKVAFAWTKDNNGYHIWEIDIATKATKQITDNPTGLKVSDFEPCYLPNGDIMFGSSRVFGTVDCNFNITSNMFLMDSVGRYLRRIGFDQVHTFYPTMMADGKVMYCRWEYNDRNVSTVFGIFTMNIDGTHQNEYYGNQTTTPNTLCQAREIPGTDGMALARPGGHMGKYNGALCTVDPNLGRNGSQSAKLICPSRSWSGGGGYSMTGVPEEEKLFQNPYPLDKTRFLISHRTSSNSKFGIYLMTTDGKTKELIASDASMSVSQPIPLVERTKPPIPAYMCDYTKKFAELKMTNAYYGLGTGSAVKAGTIAKIRVVALEYRVQPWFGNTGASAYTSTPIARWLGSWEAKRIVGEMKVESDGSAAMLVPTRTPLYFQLIDTGGCLVQTARSWATLQPGEKWACYGCHEDKNIAPPPVLNPIASEPKELNAFYNVKDDYLSFPRYIQPLLNEHCTSCHKSGHSSGLDLSGTTFWTGTLSSDNDNKTACKNWSNAYYNLSTGLKGFTTKGKYVTISGFDVNAQAEGLRPNSTGSGKSPLITKLKSGQMGGQAKTFPKEVIDKLAAWIDLAVCYSGYYSEGMKPSDSVAYEKRWQSTLGVERALEDKNIQEFIAAGQWGNVAVKPDGKSAGHALSSNKQLFSIRFSLDGRKLIANIPCEGTLTLLDLSGRQIMIHTFARDAVKNGASVMLRGTGLTRGLYVVKFTGGNVVNQRTITVL
jgi:hypothetical protein